MPFVFSRNLKNKYNLYVENKADFVFIYMRYQQIIIKREKDEAILIFRKKRYKRDKAGINFKYSWISKSILTVS